MRRTCRHCGYCIKRNGRYYCNDYDFEIDNIDMPQDHECED